MENTISPSKPVRFAVIALIILASMVAFSPVLDHDFVNWDDTVYVVDNPMIRSTAPGNIRNIFTSYVMGNYQPLVILSFAFEYRLSQLNPWTYHFTNLLLHIFNVALAFGLAKSLAKDFWVAAGTAALFALHPMRVESVAWITERKDVLFCFFYLSSLICYYRYLNSQRKEIIQLLLCLGLFILSCLSKPAAVTLPMVLILLDYFHGRKLTFKIIAEKAGFFIISLIFGCIALRGLSTPLDYVYLMGADPAKMLHGQMVPYTLAAPELTAPTFLEKIILSTHAVVVYMFKLFWIVDLAAYYPYPQKVNGFLPWFFYVSPLIILLLVACLIKAVRANQKIIVFGFLFFLVTIVLNLPVWGVGHAVIADRFTYIPYFGLFLILTSVVRGLYLDVRTEKINAVLVVCVFISCIAILEAKTHHQSKIWQNSGTLWSDVIIKNPTDAMAFFNRGNYYLKQYNLQPAIRDYSLAVKYNPRFFPAFINRGKAFSLVRNYRFALLDYNAAIKLQPENPIGYINRGGVYLKLDEPVKAAADARKALALSPGHPLALKILEIADERPE